MKRKRTITIELERDVVIAQRQRRAWFHCPHCGAANEIPAAPDHAAIAQNCARHTTENELTAGLKTAVEALQQLGKD